jgi:hypothetical protein
VDKKRHFWGTKSCLLGPTIKKFHNQTDANKNY